MSSTLTYQYAQPSGLTKTGQQDALFLAQYSEVAKSDASCFFWGTLIRPHITARSLMALAAVVQANYARRTQAWLRDPIVTAGGDQVRFEAFSDCAGVYARVDLLPDAHDGEFPATGTTNVDFNPGMIAALNRIRQRESVQLAVGPRDVTLVRASERVVERKVPLPTKWLKGLTSVQVYLANAELRHEFTRLQALQLLRSLPRSRSRQDHYLLHRGARVQLSPAPVKDALCVGGVERLRLLEPLLPYVDQLRVYAHPEMQATAWQLVMGPVHFTLVLSRESRRGFSGEGAALDALNVEVPDTWVQHLDQYSYANQQFNPTLLAIEEDLDPQQLAQVSARLSAMGLLGFDLLNNQYFYRRLPFKLSRIRSLNPRLKNAEKLLARDGVEIRQQRGDYVEARVRSSTGTPHTVILDGSQARCTCQWYSEQRGQRGPCKHILAVRRAKAASL